MERSIFEELVRAHHAAVYQSARRIARSDADAADVVQEVFLEVLGDEQRFAEAREPGRVLRWMAARKALAQLRAARNRRRRESAMEREHEGRDEGLERMERGEVRALVGKLLAGLPEDLRHALALRFGEGMTYAAIAEASECSEPTAHERVKQGLESLRVRLARAGHATSLSALGGWLELPDGAPRVPGELEARLLGLWTTTATTAALHVIAPIVAAVVLIGAGGLAMVRAVGEWRESAVSERAFAFAPEERAEAVEVPAGFTLEGPARGLALELESGSERAARGSEPREPPTGTLVGRALDEDRRALEGVLVIASSLARDGKFARFELETRTDVDGRFTLELPIEREEGQDYVALLQHPEYVRHRSEVVSMRAGEMHELSAIVLLANSEDHTGEWTLSAFVVDEAGAPVAGALVIVERRLRTEGGGWTDVRESSGRSDAAGRVELAGAHLGEKLVLVRAESQGFREARHEHAIDRGGHDQQSFVLERGLTIRGRVLALGEALPPSGLEIHAIGADPNRWLFPELAPDGRFELRGLEQRDYTLRLRADGISPAELRLPAGAEGVALELKRRDDPRAVGTHLAELHGELVDAATGAPVEASFWDVEVIGLTETERELAPETLRALHREARMAQRASLSALPPPSDRFHLVGLPAGHFLVVARVNGYAPAFAGPFELQTGELRAGIEVRLSRGATLSGFLRDRSGAPLADGFVWLGPLAEDAAARLSTLDALLLGEDPRWLPGCVRTGEDGRFVFEHLPAGLPFATGGLHREHRPALGARVELHEAELRAGVVLELAPR